MQVYLNVLGFNIPTYGMMIVSGVLLANLLAMYILKKTHLDYNDFLILECFGILGGCFGAKILYLLVSFRYIDWSRITEPLYLNSLIQGGFVFYGGLIGGLLAVYAAGRLYRIPVGLYIRKCIFLLPFVHAFGRIGCFMAGCCYGIPYKGFGAVVFPKHCFAPAGISLFPVQLVEAAILLLLSTFLLIQQWRGNSDYLVETYLIAYGLVRFFLEFFRYDMLRGKALILSTSQWISLLMISLGIGAILYKRLKKSAIPVRKNI